MKTKAYNSFNDIHGNHYSFDNYMDFAVWWFDVPYRRRIVYFDAVTFKKLQYAAVSSTEAKRPRYQAA
jgi:hypothetical protein